MATYIGIKGVEIQTIAGDPANPIAGQVWYNTTANTLKGYGAQGAAAWSSGTATPTALRDGGLAGTATAALTFGGAAPGNVDSTFEYDGTSWTSGGAYPISQDRASGFGTQTAALGAAGNEPPRTDTSNTYNGSSWTAGPTVNTARSGAPAFGTQTAAVMAGGWTDPTRIALAEEFNGTAWSEETAMPAVKADGGGGGSSTAGLSFLGTYTPGAGGRTTASFAYNGSSWTATNSCNTARSGCGGGGTAPTTTMTYGGEPPGYFAGTEQFDGTSWTEVADLSTGRQGVFVPLSQATQAAQLCIMGDTGTALTTVEEWSTADATKTFTSS